MAVLSIGNIFKISFEFVFVKKVTLGFSSHLVLNSRLLSTPWKPK